MLRTKTVDVRDLSEEKPRRTRRVFSKEQKAIMNFWIKEHCWISKKLYKVVSSQPKVGWNGKEGKERLKRNWVQVGMYILFSCNRLPGKMLHIFLGVRVCGFRSSAFGGHTRFVVKVILLQVPRLLRRSNIIIAR